MKTIQLTGLNQMALREVPAPEIKKDTDVLIKMAVVGVCGSDVHYYKEGRIGSQVVEYPFAVGHEGSGIIEAVGPAVDRVKPGDRVAIEPAMPCWTCDQCRCGRFHTCRQLKFLGCPGQAEGCLSEYIVMPQESCFPIPETMSLEDAALSEPLSIGVYAVQLAAVQKGAKVGILGSGPIGLSVLLPVNACGAEAVYMTDKIDSRLTVARQCGASWGGNPDKLDIVQSVSDLEPGLLDVVFECCGEQEAVDQALALLKPGGKLMFIGIPTVDHIAFCMDLMRRKEICVQNVRRQNECVQKTLDWMHDKTFDASPLVTHRFKFSETEEAFKLVADYRDGVVKAMIHFD